MLKDLKAQCPQMVPLDITVHRDETTPHIHFRFVIEGHDKSGHIKPLKAQGLREMGFERPDLTQPNGRFNNPLMTFTDKMRDTLYQKIEDLGLDLDRTPHLNQQHVETLRFKKNALAEDIRSLKIEKAGAELSLEAEKTQIAAKREELQADYDQERAILQAQYEAEQARIEAEKRRDTAGSEAPST